jgi:hypothetical protein
MNVRAELDHLAFVVSDVAVTQQALCALGFQTTASGACVWHDQHGAHSARCVSVVFPTHYLDFIESAMVRLPSSSDPGPQARGVVPSGLALRMGRSLEEALTAVRAAGIEPRPSYEIERRLSGQEATAIRYRFCSLPRSATGLPIGVIEDREPQLLRRPKWMAHPNAAVGISRLHFRVASGSTAAAKLRRVLDPLSREATMPHAVQLGTVTLHLDSDPKAEWLRVINAVLPQEWPAALLGIELSVNELQTAQCALDAGRIDYHALAAHSVVVEPRFGLGCGVVFASSGG